MPRNPAADFGGVMPAAVVEPAILIAAARRVVFGLGVTQQHQTAHGAISIRSRSEQINVQADALSWSVRRHVSSTTIAGPSRQLGEPEPALGSIVCRVRPDLEGICAKESMTNVERNSGRGRRTRMTSARSVRKKTSHERDFCRRTNRPDVAALRQRSAPFVRSGCRHLRGRRGACRPDGGAGSRALRRERRRARRPARRLERLRPPARHGDAGLWSSRSAS